MTRHIASLALASLLAVACATSLPILHGGEKDANGCFTYTENDCYDAAGKFSGCCLQTFTCGGGAYSVGCPADECCDVDNYVPEFRRDPYADAASFDQPHPERRLRPARAQRRP